jgi:hypothetical protein
MPILTKNETPTKGQKAEFQLDKAALAALSSVSSDIYFSDMTNWNQVELVYVSPVGRQRKVVKFDATQATPVGVFFASLKAKNDFQIQYIMINDFDGGEFKINRSELTVAEFDIDVGGPAPVVSLNFTQGSLPPGSSVVSGTAPDMSNASAKFIGQSAQINMPIEYIYVSGASYNVRLYIKSVNQYSGHSVSCALNSLFRTSYYPSMSVNEVDPTLNLVANVGGYIEYNFAAGPQFNDGFPVILSVQISPSGWIEDHLEITKIEIFEV